MTATYSWDYNRTRRTIAGDLKVVLVEQPHLHYGAISIHVGAGSRYEPEPDNGLAHFVEHMVFRGTRRFRDSFELNLAVERLGGTLAASTSPDSTEYSLTLPTQTLEAGIDLLAELVIRPRFQELETERKVIIEEIREDLDERGKPIDIDFLSRRRLWPKNPLGQCVTGSLENAMGFTREDLQRFFDSNYTTGNAIVCISGGFLPKQVLPAVEQAFRDMKRGPAPERSTRSPKPSLDATFAHAHKPGSQTQLRLAFHAPGISHRDTTASDVMIRLLDDGMSTPLHRRVFETRGLAYNVSASQEAYPDVGALNFDASCSHDNVASVLEEMLSITNDLRSGPIEDRDLEKAIDRSVWGLEEYQDSAEAMCSWYGEQELFRDPPTIESEAETVRRIGPDDIRRVCNSIFTHRGIHVTTVGVLDDEKRATIEDMVNNYR